MIKTENVSAKENISSFSATISAVIKGTAFAYVVLVFAFVVLALVYTYTPMADKSLEQVVGIIGKVSVFAAGFMSSAKAKQRGWLHGILAGLIYESVHFVLGYLVFKNHVASEGILQTLAVSAVIAVAGGIAGVNTKGNKRKSSSAKFIR